MSAIGDMSTFVPAIAMTDAVDLDRYVAVVVHQHIVDLRRSNAVAAGRVDPDGDIPGAGHQLILEKLRRDGIVKPAFLGDGPVQEQRSLLNLLLRILIHHRPVFPIPELLHRIFPPFRDRC